MNKLTDLVRLIFTEPMKSVRWIAARLAVSKSSVQRYRSLIRKEGHTWETLEPMPPEKLDALFNTRDRKLDRVAPDFTNAAEELQQKGVNRVLLWEEYRDQHGPRALGYSRFAQRYEQHARAMNVVMRQQHNPGETVFVDFSGARPNYTDPATGREIPVEVFVAVLGASNYTFVYCLPTQSELDWIDAHVRMFDFFGGCPETLVPDNLRAAVNKAGREGELQKVYKALGEHYGIAILPARPYKPRDKGKVEKAVQFAQTRILGPLRKRTFHSIAELNAAVAVQLEALNARPFQRMPDSRRDRFLAIEQAALRPLPATRYLYKEWSPRVRVPKDYHVKIFDHYYSVPFELSGRHVEASLSSDRVEIFCDHKQVAQHLRNTIKAGTTTDPKHLSPNHFAQAQRSHDGFTTWATAVGPNTQALVAQQFAGKVPLQGLTACDAFRNIAHKHGDQRLEQAAARAVSDGLSTVSAIKHYLKNLPAANDAGPGPVVYANVRGATALIKEAA